MTLKTRCQSQNVLDPCLLRERERERERDLKKSEIPSEFQAVWICLVTGACTVCRQKLTRDDAPTHPLTEIPGIAHERHTWIKSGGPGPLTIALFVFNDSPTVKVI